MIELKHYNDGKGRWQSHSITCDEMDPMQPTLDFSSVYGYGETQEEALEDFRKNFKAALDRINAFATMLLETDALVPIEVDCLGKPIKEEQKCQPRTLIIP